MQLPISYYLFFVLLTSITLNSTEPQSFLQSIDLVEGTWVETAQDLSTPGPFGLVLSRTFSKEEGWQFNVNGFFGRSIKLQAPQPSCIVNTYDASQKIVQQKLQRGNQIAAWLDFFYEKNSAAILSSKGSIRKYTFTLPNLTNALLIEKVEGDTDYLVEYKYHIDSKGKKIFIIERNERDGIFLKMEYFPNGKIKTLYQSLDEGITYEAIYQFEYENNTTIVDSTQGLKNFYTFNQNKELVKLATYLHGVLYRSEDWEWSFGKLLRKVYCDGNGTVLKEESFCYDAQGNVINEALIGCLTKVGQERETYEVRHSYDHLNRLIETRKPNGVLIVYGWDNFSRLINKKTFIENELIDEEWKTYSEDGQIIEERTLNPQRFRKIHYNHQGLPVEEVQGLYDIKTGGVIVDAVKTCRYFSSGLLKDEEFAGKTISYEYDSYGTLVLAKSSDGICYCKEKGLESCQNIEDEIFRQVIKEYGKRGELLVETHVENGQLVDKTTYVYDNALQCRASFDLGGNMKSQDYDPLGRKVLEIMPPVLNAQEELTSFRWEYAYDALDRLTHVQDPGGNQTATIYNARGDPLTILYPDGSQEGFEYSLDGNLIKKTFRDGTVVCKDVDGGGRVLSQSNYSALGKLKGLKWYGYEACKLLSETQSCGLMIECFYDDYGRVLHQKVSNEGNLQKKVDYAYEDNGKLSFQKEWYGSKDCDHIVVYPQSPSKEVHKPLKKIFWRSNEQGQIVKEVLQEDACNLIRSEVYDPLLRVEKVTLSTLDHQIVESRTFRYDFNNCKVKEVINDAIVNFWSFTSMKQLEEVCENAGSCNEKRTRYYYNLLGQLEVLLKPSGEAIYHFYDDAGQLIRLKDSSDSFDYAMEYDDKGQMVAYEDLKRLTKGSQIFDACGQLIGETLLNGLTLQYECDNLGRRILTQLPDQSKIRYVFTKHLERIERLDAKGSIKYAHRCSVYDEKGFLTKAEAICDLGIVNYKWAGSGRLQSISSPYFSEKAVFDSSDRVIALKTKDPSGYKESEFSYNPLSQLVRDEDASCLLEYDFNGNLIFKKNGIAEWSMKYDALDRLTEVFQDGCLVHSYCYDPFHRRVEDVCALKRFIYDGLWEMGVCDKEGSILELRIFEPSKLSDHGGCVAMEFKSLKEEAEVFLPLYDLSGSLTVLVSTLTKKACQWIRYTPFGVSTSYGQAISPWLFRNKRQDSNTSWIYFGRRDYDPSLSKWLTKDPLFFADGHDRYAFLQGNPLNYREMFGLKSIAEWIRSLFDWGLNLLKKIKDYCISPWDSKKTVEYVVGKGNLLILGNIPSETEAGVWGLGEVSGNVRISFIIGILNEDGYFSNTLNALSVAHGNVNIHYIKRGSKGLLRDLVAALAVKFGWTSSEAKLLAATWKQMISDMGGPLQGGKIIHYAHSLGVLDTYKALQMLSLEEQKMIEVYGFGPPSFKKHATNAYVRLFISARDGIALFDPLGFFRALTSNFKDIAVIGSFLGMPFIDHLFSNQTYQDLWKSMGRNFVEWYGSV